MRHPPQTQADIFADIFADTFTTSDDCIEPRNPILGGQRDYPHLIRNNRCLPTCYWVWEFLHGPLNEEENRTVEGMTYVIHTCTNNRCINPQHLKRGNRADDINQPIAQQAEKARELGPRYVDPNRSEPYYRLTETDVHEIRRLLSEGHKQKHIAAHYSVARSTISCIKKGRSWGWLKSPTTLEDQD